MSATLGSVTTRTQQQPHSTDAGTQQQLQQQLQQHQQTFRQKLKKDSLLAGGTATNAKSAAYLYRMELSPMRGQEEVIFAYLHCRYGPAWGAIAAQLPLHTPDSLARRWQVICETGRGCQQLLSDYAYNLRKGQPPAAAFVNAVHRLPPGAKSQLLSDAGTKQELEQVTLALRAEADPSTSQFGTAADPSKVQLGAAADLSTVQKPRQPDMASAKLAAAAYHAQRVGNTVEVYKTADLWRQQQQGQQKGQGQVPPEPPLPLPRQLLYRPEATQHMPVQQLPGAMRPFQALEQQQQQRRRRLQQLGGAGVTSVQGHRNASPPPESYQQLAVSVQGMVKNGQVPAAAASAFLNTTRAMLEQQQQQQQQQQQPQQQQQQQQQQPQQQQQQQPLSKQDPGRMQGSACDPCAEDDAILQDIDSLERAMQQLAERGQRYVDPKQQPGQGAAGPSSRQGTGAGTGGQRPSSAGPAADQHTASQRAQAEPQAGQLSGGQARPQGAAAAQILDIAKEASRSACYKAIGQQLKQAPELVDRIKSKVFVDLDKQQRQHSSSGQQPAPQNAAFVAAVTRNEGNVLAAAAHAVLADRAPRVRIAPAQHNGTKRVISAADLQSTQGGRSVLQSLQALLLIPTGDLPAGAQLVVEVALPAASEAAQGAAATAAPTASDTPGLAVVQRQSTAGAAPKQQQHQQQQREQFDLTADEASEACAAQLCLPPPAAQLPGLAVQSTHAATAAGGAAAAAGLPPAAGKEAYRSGGSATAGGVVAHVRAGSEGSASEDASGITNSSIGRKRSLDEEQVQQQGQNGGPGEQGNSAQPPAKRKVYKAELFL